MTDMILPAGIAVIAGFTVGYVYFRALWWSVRRLTRKAAPHGRPWRAFALSGVLRLGGLLAFLGAFLWWGVAPAYLLAGGFGFLGARCAVLTHGSPLSAFQMRE